MTDFITRPAGDFQQVNHLKRLLKGIDGFIAGGAFKNSINGERTKDVDIFFPSEIAWVKAVKKFRKRGYTQAYENSRVIAFIDPITKIRLELIGAATDEEWPDNELPVEYGTPAETIARFDFTITKFALFKQKNSDNEIEWMVVHHPDFFEHLHMKRLVIDDDLVKPLSTFERSYRYAGYGYKLCRGSKKTLVVAIQGTDFEDDAQLSASFYDGMD